MTKTYTKKLEQAVWDSQSLLCVGLDPVLERLPDTKLFKNKTKTDAERVATFCKIIIDVTSPYCCSYKINIAFFESLGAAGIGVFETLIDYIDYIPSTKIIIADAKRGDIATSSEQYRDAFYRRFNVDAITLNPLMGFETLAPYLDNPEKGLYVLVLTSNPGANDFLLQSFRGETIMAQYIARQLKELSSEAKSHIGMVVGATQQQHFSQAIANHPTGGLLIPGIGTQGGRVEPLVKLLANHTGLPLITSSRSIIYAGENQRDWKQAVQRAARNLKQTLQPLVKQYV